MNFSWNNSNNSMNCSMYFSKILTYISELRRRTIPQYLMKLWMAFLNWERMFINLCMLGILLTKQNMTRLWEPFLKCIETIITFCSA